MNIYQKHINKKTKMVMEMYNYKRGLKGERPLNYREWRIVNRIVVGINKNQFKLDNKRSLFEFRQLTRKEYNLYLNEIS